MSVLRTRILGGLCICIVMGLLVVGLWPFHHSKNQVSWLVSGNGLHLGGRGSIWSADVVKMNSSQDDIPCSLEAWLQPDLRDDTGTILAFYDPGTGLSFSMRQEITDLVVRKERRGQSPQTITKKGHADELFHANKPIFLTLASGPQGTSIYADGSFVKTLPGFRLSGKDLAGRLIVGDSPLRSDGWSGQLRGLAFYLQDLTATQVFRHYAGWIRVGRPDVDEKERPFALYLLAEHNGNITRSAFNTGVELYIPDKYSILDKIFLEAPWKAFRPTWDYWQDVAVNIGGFVPLGLFAGAYLSLTAPNRWVALAVIALGGTISLTIESLQVFLPTRDSDMTDVITNTLGTCIGVAMLRWNPARRAVDHVLGLCEFVTQQLRISFTN
jgi:VanZ family protein